MPQSRKRSPPRQLPSRYFYDPLGSALFEAICELPWYRITKVERALLAHHADPNIASKAGMFPLYAIINAEWAPKTSSASS